MRRVLRSFVLMIFLCGLVVPSTLAQEDEGSPEAPATARPYLPPPAWKSVEIGNFYFKRKKYPGALSRFQEAVRTDPTYAPGYAGLGKVYEKIGLKQKALEAYRKYLDTLPSEKQAEEAKDVHQAIARLERGLKSAHARSLGQEPRHASSQPH